MHRALPEQVFNSLDTVLETWRLFQPPPAVSPPGDLTPLWLGAPLTPVASPGFHKPLIPAPQRYAAIQAGVDYYSHYS